MVLTSMGLPHLRWSPKYRLVVEGQLCEFQHCQTLLLKGEGLCWIIKKAEKIKVLHARKGKSCIACEEAGALELGRGRECPRRKPQAGFPLCCFRSDCRWVTADEWPLPLYTRTPTVMRSWAAKSWSRTGCQSKEKNVPPKGRVWARREAHHTSQLKSGASHAQSFWQGIRSQAEVFLSL